MSSTVALVTNSTFNVTNFRWGLVTALRAAGHRVVVIAPAGPEAGEIRAAGMHFEPLGFLDRSGLNPLANLVLIRELAKLYRKYEVDTALLYTAKPVIFGTLAARWAGVRSVCTLTGLGFAYIRGGGWQLLMDRLYKTALHRADWVFFHNPDDRTEFLARKLVSSGRSSVVGGSGVNLDHFPPVDFTQADTNHFLFIGRLLTDKGVREFVAAARSVRKTHPGAHFTIIGGPDGGNPAGISGYEATEWGQQAGIHYLGPVRDVRPHLATAGVVVLPSYREGLPRTLLEAAATGRPLLATDVPGCREICLPGKTGWLVPARNAAALAEAMRTALATPRDRLAELGENGRRLVEERFSEAAVIAAYLAKVSPLSN